MLPVKILTFLADSVVRLMTFGVALLMFVEVMIRMFLPDYILTWQEEVARSMLVYMTVIGGALALHDRSHFTMPMIVRRLPRSGQRAAAIFSIVLVLVFSLVWLTTSIPWVQSSANTLTPALQWDYRMIYAAFPIGAFMMTVYAIYLLIRQLRMPEPLELGHTEAESALHTE